MEIKVTLIPDLNFNLKWYYENGPKKKKSSIVQAKILSKLKNLKNRLRST